jgi:hypothetical protein
MVLIYEGVGLINRCVINHYKRHWRIVVCYSRYIFLNCRGWFVFGKQIKAQHFFTFSILFYRLYHRDSDLDLAS